jgi:NTP pyrophosphatase (non-canonical NTP hydrolase)
MSEYLLFHDFQVESQKTAVYPGQNSPYGLVYAALGLNGEAGEVAEQAKKMLRDDFGNLTPDRVEKIRKELGDLLWYAAQVATEAGLDLDDVALTNIRKLKDRQERGVLHGSGDDR